MAHAMERLLATPKTMPDFPASNMVFISIGFETAAELLSRRHTSRLNPHGWQGEKRIASSCKSCGDSAGGRAAGRSWCPIRDGLTSLLLRASAWELSLKWRESRAPRYLR